MQVGTVISTETTPSSSEFHFVVEKAKENEIHKGMFVQIRMNEGILIGRISEILKANRYFSSPEMVSEYETSGGMEDSFPIKRWEMTIAEVTSLGLVVDGRQERVTKPPSPGDKVELVNANLLSQFLGFDQEKGIEIGALPYHNIPVRLNLTKLFQKHCSILASTGFGKSHLTSVIIEEILERPEEYGKPAIIVIDPHGEYNGFAEDEKYVNMTRIFGKNNIRICTSKVTASMFGEFIPGMTNVQERELSKVITKLKEVKPDYSLEELIAAVEMSDIKPITKEPLVSWLEELKASKIFEKVDSPSIEELARIGQLSIFDLSDFDNLTVKQIIVAYFARRLFEARRSEAIPPFILVVEEAHQFAPEKASTEASISKGIIETIAREGRKFNASLVLISQRPIKLSTTALSQCNSNIFLRIINPYDLDHITESCEGITSDLRKMLPGLKVGEAIVTGEVVNYPVIVKVRERRSKKSEKGIPLEEALISFSKNLSKKKSDLEAF